MAVRNKTTTVSYMTFYEDLVIQSQIYNARSGILSGTGGRNKMCDKAVSYEEQIRIFADKVREAECIVIGGASELSAAGGGDFYYEDNASFRKYFGKYAEKYGFKGAFDGMFSRRFPNDEERWGYVATFLNTTINAPVRKPYLDLRDILAGKDFFVVTTNQDTQFMKIFPEEKVAEIQGDHRFFQCARCCTDDTWDSTVPVKRMIDAMGDGTSVPAELIPRCPHCGGEAFPWVRGYGNFLEGKKYQEQYAKISEYILENQNKKLLFIELGVGRMTPMFIQEPFWFLTERSRDAYYVSVNDKYALLPRSIEGRGIAITGDIQKVLDDVKDAMEAGQ